MNASFEAKPWLKSYPPGVPAELRPLEFQSIPQMLEASVQRYREQPAFQSFGVQMTYAELDRLTRDFAAYLQTGLGLRKGERVAVMMPNILQYPIAVYGILRAGLVVVSVNPLYTARELERQLKDSGAARDRDFRDRGAHPAGGHRAHTGQARDRRVDRRSSWAGSKAACSTSCSGGSRRWSSPGALRAQCSSRRPWPGEWALR